MTARHQNAAMVDHDLSFKGRKHTSINTVNSFITKSVIIKAAEGRCSTFS